MLKRRKIVLAMTLLAFLLVTVFSTAAAADELVVLHTNDIHGRVDVDEGLLGMPYVGALIDDHRQQHENVLVMDAGDTIHGRPIVNLLDGESAVGLMNEAGYDVMVPGNHDFNFGYERLLELEEMMEFELVAANVEKDGELLFDPYVIKDMGAFEVGVFGLATPDTYATTHPDNIEGIEFTDMVDAASEYVSLLQDEGVDLIVALGHVGFAGDHPSDEVAEEVDGIDLFVDGHSHDRLSEGEWRHDTLFVQAYEYTKDLGRVYVDLSGEQPVMEAELISAEEGKDLVEPDAVLEEMLEDYSDQATEIMLGN